MSADLLVTGLIYVRSRRVPGKRRVHLCVSVHGIKSAAISGFKCGGRGVALEPYVSKISYRREVFCTYSKEKKVTGKYSKESPPHKPGNQARRAVHFDAGESMNTVG
jgi:hypothetical protein